MQEIFLILWSPNADYRVNKNQPLVTYEPDESTPHPISVTSISILYSHLRLELQSDLLISGFKKIVRISHSTLSFPLIFYLQHSRLLILNEIRGQTAQCNVCIVD